MTKFTGLGTAGGDELR